MTLIIILGITFVVGMIYNLISFVELHDNMKEEEKDKVN